MHDRRSGRLQICDGAFTGFPSREARTRRVLHGSVLTPSGSRYDLMIRNLSSHGIGAVVHDGGIKTGDVLIVRLPALHRIVGRVRWIQDEAFGMETPREIDLAMLPPRPDAP